jgi:hypothetical protein
VDTYVRSHASIVSPGKDGVEYGQLSDADKKIVDQCVSDRPYLPQADPKSTGNDGPQSK